jgi:23S rRNA (guanosine2251-2'-O)-methyltransferase
MLEKNEMIFGVRAVIEAIQAGREIDKVLVKKDIQSELSKELFACLKNTLIPVQRVPVERINRITRKNHQGVVAFISSVTYQKTEDLVPFLFEEGKTPLFVMLDGITDVRNFGAIARTCECAGADAIIIPSKNSVSVNADAMKTSAGALHTLPVCREQNLTNTIKYLKDCGFKIVAATEKGDYDYTKANYKDPVCIIMGAEEVTEVVVVDVETYVCAESKLGQYLPCESSVHVEVLTNTFLIVVVEGCDWVFQSVVDVALIEEKAS